MDHYDEDLFENVFFQTLQTKFPQLFDEATTKRWMITVPRCAALEKLRLEQEDFENHILLPVDDQPTVFHTASHKVTSIKGNIITTDEGFEKKKMVAILFEETFFNKTNESYRVLCISQPLEGGMDFNDDVNHLMGTSPTALYSYDNCCQILWGNTGNRNTRTLLANAVDGFKATLNKKACSSLKSLVDQVNALFKKCLNIVLKDRVLKRSAMSNVETRNSIYVAVETYLIQHTYQLLFRNVCTFMADKDEKLNKILRNFPGLQLKHLNIRPQFCHQVPRARTELSNISRVISPMKKLHCLKRVLTVLVSENDGSFLTPAGIGGVIGVNGADGSDDLDLSPFGSDDLLPILVFLIMKTEIPNWWSQWTFMKNFYLAMPVLTSEFECYLSHLEAALEYITSGQLRELRIQNDLAEFDTSSNRLEPSSPQDELTRNLAELFQKVATNNKEAVGNILGEADSPVVEEPITDILPLCHPLCDCPKCLRALNRSESSNLKSSVDAQSQNDQGLSALHVAAIFGHIDMVDLLLEKGADVNATDILGQTPLHLAARRGHQKLIMLFLHHDASINQQDRKKNSALHWASANGHNDCVKALIYIGQNNRKPVDLNLTNDSCETALHLAAKWGYESIVGMLLEHGAVPGVRNRKNQTPLDVAHNSKICDLISQATAFEKTLASHTSSLKGNHKMSSILSRKLSIVSVYSSDSISADGRSDRPSSAPAIQPGWVAFPALGTAQPRPTTAQQSLERKVEKLLRFVADGDIQMIKHHLEWSEYELDNPEVNDLDVTKITLCHPLCQCNQCRHFQRLTLPSKSGIHLNCQNIQGYTPLHVASLHGHGQLVRLLLQRGARVRVATKTQLYTPLHCACKQTNVKIMKLLIDYGTDVMARDSEENTPLHLCCLLGYTAQLWLLLQSGADINAANSQGNTPLHVAVKKNHTSAVRMAIQSGADVTLHNSQNQTPLSLIDTPEMSESVQAALVQRSWLCCSSRLFSVSDYKQSRCDLSRNKAIDSRSDAFLISDHRFDTPVNGCIVPNDKKKSTSFSSVLDLSVSKSKILRRRRFTKDDSSCMTFEEAVCFVNRCKTVLLRSSAECKAT